MIELTDPMEQLNDINNLNKYKSAGIIATKASDEIVKNIKNGIKLLDLVNIGNNFINLELDKVHKDVKNKGLSFPICLSLNNIAGHYIPNNTEVIKEGDILKIELGVHIDGFPANIVYSTIFNGVNKLPLNDKRAKVMKACIETSKELFKIMKPGNTNCDVAKIMEEYATKYNCNSPVCNEQGAIPGVLSYQMSRYVADGYNDDDNEYVHRFILSKQNPNYEYSMRETEFEENEVYAIDILMSSGSGKLTPLDKTDIYKRNHEQRIELKLKSSKDALREFNKTRFPISLQNKETRIKLGLKECLEKKLLEKYSVVKEKEGEYIARIKFTVIIKDNPILVCGKSGDPELAKFD